MNLNEVLNLPLVLNEPPSPELYSSWFRGHDFLTMEEVFERRYVQRLVNYRYWRSRLSEAQNHKCCFCGCVMTEERNKRNSSTIEHVIPKSKGGPDHPDNFAASCDDCNNKRGDLPVDEFLEKISG